MWLRLTYFDEAKTPVKINFDLVEAFQSNDGGGTIVSVSTTSYHVSETFDEVERMLLTDPKFSYVNLGLHQKEEPKLQQNIISGWR